MFCTNCGNKLEENAYVCLNCGVILRKRSETMVVKEKGDTQTLGIVSIILGSIAMLLSFMLFFHDISSAGMYTEAYERIFYALDYSLSAILIATVTLIFSLVSKRNTYSNIGLFLAILSFFFIITEVVVVVIY